MKITDTLKKELPEIYWDSSNNGFYFANCFCIYEYDKDICTCRSPLLIEKLKEENHFKINWEDWNGVLRINNIEDLDSFISSVRNWIKKCEDIKKISKRDVDQVVFLHSDIIGSFEDLLRDTKCCTTNASYGTLLGIGIINTKNWDFSNISLLETLEENSLGSFSIEPYIPEYHDDWLGPKDKELIEKFYKNHPEAKEIKEIYITDWD